ncbi:MULTISPECIES: hypothetical protein [unclassified Brevundimonas]|uniref:hypothetical protein n=1 Tax=unclassified Brevundimonas TaxID=2622653 RepID=UPI0025B8B1D9|nr:MULTISPECIES: hypothetical protein [unclassified Brevundimonas]
MLISQRQIPPTTKATFGNELFAASPGVAIELMNAINAWATLEAKVEGIFGHLTEGDPSAMAAFKDLLGWDRRAKALGEKVAAVRPELQDHVAGLLNHVKEAADLRNEIAHSLWGVDQDGQMLISPSDMYGRVSVHASGENADAEMPEFISTLFRDGRMVGMAEATAARQAIEAAEGLMHAAWLGFFSPERDETGASFEDLINSLKTHPGIAERALNRARWRAREEKSKAKAGRSNLDAGFDLG